MMATTTTLTVCWHTHTDVDNTEIETDTDLHRLRINLTRCERAPALWEIAENARCDDVKLCVIIFLRRKHVDDDVDRKRHNRMATSNQHHFFIPFFSLQFSIDQLWRRVQFNLLNWPCNPKLKHNIHVKSDSPPSLHSFYCFIPIMVHGRWDLRAHRRPAHTQIN